MERSADVLAAGLLEMSDPSLSSKFFLRQVRPNYIHLHLSICFNLMDGACAGLHYVFMSA